MTRSIVGVLLLLAAPAARADDGWCAAPTVESAVRRSGTAPFVKKKDLSATVEQLRGRLATDLLGMLAAQVDARYQAEILAQTSRVQLLSSAQRKVQGGREVCVVVQMDKGGLLGALPSDVGKALLATWVTPVADFAKGRPVWVREVALRDRAEPEFDDVVVPRVEDIIRRNLMGIVRWEPEGAMTPPPDVVTFDVRVTPYPGHYAVEGVLKDAAGRSISVGAELAKAWLGEVGARQPLSARELHIASFDVPPSVARGKPVKMSWVAKNARSCRIDPVVGDVPITGSVEVLPTADTTYRLQCTDGVRTTTREASVALFVPAPKLTAGVLPERVPVGGSAAIGWQASGVTGCTIAPGIGPVGTAGQVQVVVTQPTTWTISCQGEDGSVKVKTVSIGIGEPEPVEVAPAPAVTAGVRFVLRSLDDDWLDVRVDGQVVATLYNTKEATVTVGPGRHTVEVVPFMGSDPVHSAVVEAGTTGVATLGLHLEKPVACYDAPVCLVP
jgi:hypothetical protein